MADQQCGRGRARGRARGGEGGGGRSQPRPGGPQQPRGGFAPQRGPAPGAVGRNHLHGEPQEPRNKLLEQFPHQNLGPVIIIVLRSSWLVMSLLVITSTSSFCKCLGHLNLQLVGRNFFDAIAKVTVPEPRMELWPGYATSIGQHESAILMCVEITHKVMRHDTVLQLLSECAQEDRANYKRLFQFKIIGSVVLIEYNSRTYHLDDVDFNSTLPSTFQKRDGSGISYMDYFEVFYNSLFAEILLSSARTAEYY